MNLPFPTTINIELTNRCNKNCWMCGRRKVEKDNPKLYAKYNQDMDFSLLKKISKQILPYTVVQFHNNGEPFLYPKLKEALQLFKHTIRCLDTNGKMLLEKVDDVINNLDSITISTFEKDDEWKEQYLKIKEFLDYKKEKLPNVVIRILGDNLEKEKHDGINRIELYKSFNCLIAKRVLHSPYGSFKYKKETIKPEHGICLEMLNHPAIDVKGNVSYCVRFDKDGEAILGNLTDNTFEEIWNSPKRKKLLKLHKEGRRQEIPFCGRCDFYGIPRG